MKIVLAGGSGFIGGSLKKSLESKGISVTIISRTAGENCITWKQLKSDGLPRCDAVINLAGASVMGRSWSKRYKEEMLSSRVETSKALAEAIGAAARPPKVFINASAVGYYSPSLTESYSEFGRPGKTFLGTLCQAWEAASLLPAKTKTRRVIIRIGVVLGNGGALARMRLPFKLGLGGAIGDGQQPFPWIHIEDLVGIFEHALTHEDLDGVLNAVAPAQVTNGEMTQALACALHRPAFFRVPAFALKLFLGERALLLLEGQKVLPQATLASGYRFRFPQLDKALQNIFLPEGKCQKVESKAKSGFFY